jgi:hypothetical protein
MTTEAQREQQERRETLENDRRVREQQQKAASTYFAFAVAEADEPRGRFQNSGGTTTVIGSDGLPAYPQLPPSSPWAGPDMVPPEPPLGYRIDQMFEHDPPANDPDAGATGGAADASPGLPLGTGVEHAAPPSLPEQGDDPRD